MGRDDGESRLAADAAYELIRSLGAAEAVLACPDQTRMAVIAGGRPRREGAIPWNTPAADVIMGTHAEVRRLEAGARLDVTGQAAARGGSDGNTVAAIRSLADLAPSLPREQAAYITGRMEARAAQALGLAAVAGVPQWAPISLGAGRAPPCPYCATFMLRLNEAAGVVACLKPACPGAGGGRRPFARVGRDGQGRLSWEWEDGTVQP